MKGHHSSFITDMLDSCKYCISTSGRPISRGRRELRKIPNSYGVYSVSGFFCPYLGENVNLVSKI